MKQVQKYDCRLNNEDDETASKIEDLMKVKRGFDVVDEFLILFGFGRLHD